MLQEPPGIEGFATRLRTGKAKERFYLSSHDGLVFIVRPKDAITPRLPLAPGEDAHSAPFRTESASRKSSTATSRNPSAKFGRHPASSNDLPSAARGHFNTTDHDEHPDGVWKRFLHADIERQRSMICKAVGCVDLRQVEAIVSLVDDAMPLTHTETHQDDNPAEDAAAVPRKRPAFELHLTSGKKVRFETATAAIANEWVTRLPLLQRYWKQRWESDVQMRMVAQAGGDQASAGVSVTEIERVTGRTLSSL